MVYNAYMSLLFLLIYIVIQDIKKEDDASNTQQKMTNCHLSANQKRTHAFLSFT